MRVTSVNKPMRLVAILILSFALLLSIIATDVNATTVYVLDNQVSFTDTANSISASGATVTATAKGSLFSAKTNTITITNNSVNKAQLSFSYTVTSAASFTINNVSASASGIYNEVLEAGASVTFKITSNKGLSNTTATLKFTGIGLTMSKESSNVTFEFDSTLGSVTVGGTSIKDGTVKNVNGDTGVEIKATANGCTFLGWIDATGIILSTSANYTLTPAADMTVKAAFAKDGGTPWFGVGSATAQATDVLGLLNWSKLTYYTVGVSYLFDDLNDAASTAAASASSKAVVLMNSGTLSAGTYTIPSGVTLLIPFDGSNTMYTTEVVNTNATSHTQPTAYRTLTMADGTNLVINGAMSISGKQKRAEGSYPAGGIPSGPVGFVQMQGNSNITVNNGGFLYAYGFITGSGSVTANSGATVYECFQIMDFRGGTKSSSMTNGVFALSQYYVQNIEVPLTLYAGAKEYAFSTVYMSDTAFCSALNFVASSGAMFNMTNGYITKRYDGSTDRLIIDISGDATLSNVEITVGTSSINSKNFVLPINSNITINIKSGTTTIAQSISLIPGAQITIDENATFALGSGYSMYVYDAEQWGNYVHIGNEKVGILTPIQYAPSKTYDRTVSSLDDPDLFDAFILVNGTLDASKGYLFTTTDGASIYSTGSGQVKMNTVSSGITYQYTQIDDTYHEIAVNSAWLKNGNGSYQTTTAGTYTYCADCMAWLCDDTHGHNLNHATNVELGNGLNMYFAFWNSTPLEDWADSYYVEIVHTDASGTIVKREELGKTQWLDTTVGNNKAWVVYYKNLSAKQMGDIITITLYRKDKDAEGNVQVVQVDEWSNSIQHYAMRMLKKYEDDPNKGTLRTLIVDMLNYGAACQTQFSYDTSNLVNAGLSAEQQSWATKTIVWSQTLPSGSTNNKANLIVDGNIQFAISGVNDLSSYSFTSHWGTPRDDQEFKREGNYYYISKLYVADARQVITITVGDTTWTDSIEAYCKRMIDSKNDTNGVCTAFMKFSDAARAYLHDKEGRV